MQIVRMIVGPAATGKSSVAKPFIADGYVRVNRDTLGGSYEGLMNEYCRVLSEDKNIVLDNTHLTPDKRDSFIEMAHGAGAEIHCHVMTTPIEEAQVNAVLRLISKGIYPMDTVAISESKDPNVFPPNVLFAHYKQFVKPTTAERFDSIVDERFVRRQDPSRHRHAFIFDYDGTLRVTRSGDKYPLDPSDIEILPRRAEILKDLARGNLLLGASNQSGVAKGKPTVEQAIACFERTNDLLGVDIEYLFCPHPAGPPVCWCRKPVPGMGIIFMEKYELNPATTTYIGDMKTDETFAKRCGMRYMNADEFFK